MNALVGSDNPIVYAQFTIRGGWKNILWRTALYSAAIGGIATLMVQLDRYNSAAQTLSGWTHFLLLLQAANLLLLAPARISAAIRHDIQNDLIESHRLMPLAPGRAIIGYIVGGSSMAIALAVANVMLGLCFGIMGGIGAERWLFVNGVLLGFALFIWCITAFISMSMRGAFGVIGGGLFIMATTNLMLAYCSHGTMVLTASLVDRHFIELYPELDWTQLAGAVSQFTLGVIFFIAAGRKYRQPDRPAMGVWLGMIALAAWVGISMVGQYGDRDFIARDFELGSVKVRTIVSICASMLIALCPIANATRECSPRKWHARRDGSAVSLPSFLIAMLSIGLVCLLLLQAPETSDTLSRNAILLVATSVAVFLLSTWLWLKWAYLITPRALVLAGAWITWTCLILPAVNLAWQAWRASHERVSETPPNWMSASNPISLMVQAWDAWPTVDQLIGGFVLQLSLMCVPLMLWMIAQRRATRAIAA